MNSFKARGITKAGLILAVQKTQPELSITSFEFKATVVGLAAITIPTLHVGTLASLTGYSAQFVQRALKVMEHEITGQLTEDLQAAVSQMQMGDVPKPEDAAEFGKATEAQIA